MTASRSIPRCRRRSRATPPRTTPAPARFHGYGIDRGHLARSFDRTSASLDNAFTFYFTNIVPQAADLNQGPWAIMENDLGDLARLQNKEVYIIAGVAGNKGTVKNEGKIVIPASHVESRGRHAARPGAREHRRRTATSR